MVSALGEVINDGVIHPEKKVKVKVRCIYNELQISQQDKHPGLLYILIASSVVCASSVQDVGRFRRCRKQSLMTLMIR